MGNVRKASVTIKGPFGEPDASRTDTLDEYFSVRGASPDLKSDRKLHQRIIIGKKGAGKTLFLRKLGRDLEQSSDDWLIKNEVNRLRASLVADMTRAVRMRHSSISVGSFRVTPRRASREYWALLWERAIFLSAFNIVISDERFGKRKSLLNQAKQIQDNLPQYSSTKSPITALLSFAKRWSNDYLDTRRGLEDPAWNELGEFIAEAARVVPPILIIIDGLDENFDVAPDAWTDCQHGLFRTIYDLLSRQDGFANRIHVVASIREVVFSSLLNSEHASRHLTDSHISYITWNQEAASELFRHKLSQRLNEPNFSDRRQSTITNIESWLGFSSVENIINNTREEVEAYILRHTRLLPRDIVIMCNAIDHEIETRKSANRQFSEGKLRQTVAKVAATIARESLFSCANEFISGYDYVAGTLSVDELEDLSSATKEKIDITFQQMKTSLEEEMIELIRVVGRRRFKLERLQNAIDMSNFKQDAFDPDADSFYSIENILYRHGLIQYQVSEGGTYKWKSTWREPPYTDVSTLPKNALLYQFHAILSDVVPELLEG